jgi:lysozyme
MSNLLIQQLKRHEGMKLKPYKCTAGKLTIGIGRNLDDVGISEDEAETLLHHDIIEATNQLLSAFPWMGSLNDARIGAMINFTFNVGIGTVKKFKITLEHLKNNAFEEAATEMLTSRWSEQVGARSIEITDQIRTGRWKII